MDKNQKKPKESLFLKGHLEDPPLEITLVRGENVGESVSYLWFGLDNKHLGVPTSGQLKKLKAMIEECLESKKLAEQSKEKGTTSENLGT